MPPIRIVIADGEDNEDVVIKVRPAAEAPRGVEEVTQAGAATVRSRTRGEAFLGRTCSASGVTCSRRRILQSNG
jgi:hypothetical protein